MNARAAVLPNDGAGLWDRRDYPRPMASQPSSREGLSAGSQRAGSTWPYVAGSRDDGPLCKTEMASRTARPVMMRKASVMERDVFMGAQG